MKTIDIIFPTCIEDQNLSLESKLNFLSLLKTVSSLDFLLIAFLVLLNLLITINDLKINTIIRAPSKSKLVGIFFVSRFLIISDTKRDIGPPDRVNKEIKTHIDRSAIYDFESLVSSVSSL
ncbi:hypothetical protein [Anaerosphaera multitolerans]|uniref:hypothetical protein n=1 Tax=Anaerosphaera multitolerans TaxID=2487351 RepID=UPI000FDB312C|nr:hypothetical protein [Anaerosphaera multitolerans]